MNTSNLTASIEQAAAGGSGFVLVFESDGIIVAEVEVATEQAARVFLENASALLQTNLVPPTGAQGLLPRH